MKTRASACGLTMIELLMVAAMAAVLVAIAVPTFTTSLEEARSKEAKTNLNVIHMAEKVYSLKNSQYYPPGGAGSAGNPAAVIATINTALQIDLEVSNYNISIVASGTGTSTRYTATATRTNNPAKTYTINQAGSKTPAGWGDALKGL